LNDRDWDDAAKELVRGAQKRGYVTQDQINALLPSEEVNSEQIEDILVIFSEMGSTLSKRRKPGLTMNERSKKIAG
jgi:RNA polymerase primary sigma factor